MYKIEKLFLSPTGLLTFSLLSGVGYFGMVLRIIKNYSRGGNGFLGFLFAPAIICGAALVLIKIIKTNLEREQHEKNSLIFFFHTLVIIIGAVFLVDIIL